MMTSIVVILSVFLYAALNFYVMYRINKAEYQNNDRKNIHKWFIWFMPYLGPWMIRSFWKKRPEAKLKVMTKASRKIEKDKFYESGKGMYPAN